MMNKLRDRRGASLLMALLLLLLATMVSVVILTAVSSAARHLSRDREAQQNYLTVSSAAELLRSGIKGAKYIRTETVTYTYDYDAEGNVTGSHESEPVIALWVHGWRPAFRRTETGSRASVMTQLRLRSPLRERTRFYGR